MHQYVNNSSDCSDGRESNNSYDGGYTSDGSVCSANSEDSRHIERREKKLVTKSEGSERYSKRGSSSFSNNSSDRSERNDNSHNNYSTDRSDSCDISNCNTHCNCQKKSATALTVFSSSSYAILSPK